MNNYNESINKPTINGKELIGDIKISELPAVTSADVGKVPIVSEDGSWTVGNVSGGGDPSIRSINNEHSLITHTIRKEVNENG